MVAPVTDQRPAITRFWFASMMFWPGVFVAFDASDSWLVGLLCGSMLMLSTLAVTWRMTFGNWACFAVLRKPTRR